jgi:hypothetical protein
MGTGGLEGVRVEEPVPEQITGHGGPAGGSGPDYVAFFIPRQSPSATGSQSLCLSALARWGTDRSLAHVSSW